MYRKTFCVVLICCAWLVSAQRISYGYDASGNQVSRTLTAEVYESATRSQAETSVKELCPDSFKVYPNPVQSILNVEVPLSDLTETEAFMYDYSGVLLQRVHITEPHISIDVSGYAAGVYLLKLRTLSGEITYKVVKR